MLLLALGMKNYNRNTAKYKTSALVKKEKKNV